MISSSTAQNSHSDSESSEFSTINPPTKAVSKTQKKYWKGLGDPVVLDTINLATQHFQYLVLKDPFADTDRMHGLAREGFSRAFGEKEESHFPIDIDMIKTVSIATKLIDNN